MSSTDEPEESERVDDEVRLIKSLWVMLCRLYQQWIQMALIGPGPRPVNKSEQRYNEMGNLSIKEEELV